MNDLTDSTISNYTHIDLPLEVADDRKIISDESAFYRESLYTLRVYGENNN